MATFADVLSPLSQIVDGHLSVRANLGDGAHSLRLASQQVDRGQWVLASLHRHDNLFTLRLEQGGGSREVRAWLGNRREIVVHPSSVLLGNGPTPGQSADFQGKTVSSSVLSMFSLLILSSFSSVSSLSQSILLFSSLISSSLLIISPHPVSTPPCNELLSPCLSLGESAL